MPAAGFPVEWIEVERPARQGPRSLARGAGALAARASRRRGGRSRGVVPASCSGCGGFASGPGGVAAWLAGAPLVIHEQNAIAGLTNRWLARFARVIAEGFPGQLSGGPACAIYVGNPVRPRDRRAAAAAAALRSRATGRMRLFVFGGSQGAPR